MVTISITDRGNVKPNNEDAYLLDSTGFYNESDYSLTSFSLLAVFDGVGGAKAGEVASTKASQLLGECFSSIKISDGANLEDKILATNSQLCELSASNKELEGMATTVAGVFFHKDQAISVFNLGDSRVYRLRSGLFRRLSFDDNDFNYAVLKGLATDEDEAQYKDNRTILNYLCKPDLDKEHIHLAHMENGWLKDDYFVICSDGLTSMVEDKKIESILSLPLVSLTKKAFMLQKLIEVNGSKDNYTFIICHI